MHLFLPFHFRPLGELSNKNGRFFLLAFSHFSSHLASSDGVHHPLSLSCLVLFRVFELGAELFLLFGTHGLVVHIYIVFGFLVSFWGKGG